MKIRKEELLEQMVITLKDEFEAKIYSNKETIFLYFPNNQTFCFELKEIKKDGDWKSIAFFLFGFFISLKFF